MKSKFITATLIMITAFASVNLIGGGLHIFAQPTEESSPAIKLEEPKKKISLDLRNVDINTALQAFSKETGISIVAGKSVYGTVTISLNDVDVNQALDSILKANGYTYIKRGNIVTIMSAEEPIRIQSFPDGTYVSTFIVNYIEPDKLKGTLANLMPARVRMFTTEGNKTLVIQGSLNDIKRAENLIRDIDIPPKQVMVESKIIEVSLNETTKVGSNIKYANPNNLSEVVQTVGLAAGSGAGGAQGLYYTVSGTDANLLVEALSKRTGFNILSAPKVIALNDQVAEIITGSRLGYKTKTVTTTGLIEGVEFLDVGTKLVIKPSIKSDGRIVMEIHPEISEGSIVNELPQKNSTETTTKVVIRDGETVVIGGLIRDSQKKEVKGVPILMDIPMIGAMFKQTELTSEKKEVIVLITPYIINSEMIEAMGDKVDEINAKRRYLTPSSPGDLLK